MTDTGAGPGASTCTACVAGKYSKDSALVMTNLPMPGEAQSPANYMQQVTTLVDSLPLCMLIMGQKNSDVVTMYS